MNLQREAAAASLRAAKIKNTTEEIRDKLDTAEGIQGEVEGKLAKVRGDIDASRLVQLMLFGWNAHLLAVQNSRNTLSTSEADIQALETRVQEAA